MRSTQAQRCISVAVIVYLLFSDVATDGKRPGDRENRWLPSEICWGCWVRNWFGRGFQKPKDSAGTGKDFKVDCFEKIADKVIEGIPNQINGTCYANACAGAITFAARRIVGKNHAANCIDFQSLRKEIINKYGINGGDVEKVLRQHASRCGLRFAKYDCPCQFHNVYSALEQGRVLVATFYLSDSQWTQFSTFYKENPNGTLTTEAVWPVTRQCESCSGNKNCSCGGHAVVVVGQTADGALVCLNSWGKEWGDKGLFRVKDPSVLKMDFYDVFFYEKDLSKEEQAAYRNKTCAALECKVERAFCENDGYIGKVIGALQ